LEWRFIGVEKSDELRVNVWCWAVKRCSYVVYILLWASISCHIIERA
jgi:hypothetical protein